MICLAAILLVSSVHAGCTDGGNGGCVGPPRGKKWDTWSMRSSTYTYCWKGCVVDWFYENTEKLNLNPYAGVVGVDHYWTHQGTPKPFQVDTSISAIADAFKWHEQWMSHSTTFCESTKTVFCASIRFCRHCHRNHRNTFCAGAFTVTQRWHVWTRISCYFLVTRCNTF